MATSIEGAPWLIQVYDRAVTLLDRLGCATEDDDPLTSGIRQLHLRGPAEYVDDGAVAELRRTLSAVLGAVEHCEQTGESPYGLPASPMEAAYRLVGRGPPVRAANQPPPVPGDGDMWLSVLERWGDKVLPGLRAQMVQRRLLGITRYGTPLQAYNGRDAAADLMAELLDALVYAEQLGREPPHELEMGRFFQRGLIALLERVHPLVGQCRGCDAAFSGPHRMSCAARRVTAANEQARQDDACPGRGRCHGALKWCDRCGNVAAVCDDLACDTHPYRARLTLLDAGWQEAAGGGWFHPERDRGDAVDMETALAREAAQEGDF